MQEVTFDEMAKRYCDTQLSTPDQLLTTLKQLKQRFKPKGFFLAECQQLDSSRCGQCIILPFGGVDNTFADVPTTPFSPRSLASDMSVATMYCTADLPDRAGPWTEPPPPPVPPRRRKRQ